MGRFVDILLTWRLWNFRSIAYSTMQYAMFLVMRDIRGLGPEPLARKLHENLDGEEETFGSNQRLRVHLQIPTKPAGDSDLKPATIPT